MTATNDTPPPHIVAGHELTTYPRCGHCYAWAPAPWARAWTDGERYTCGVCCRHNTVAAAGTVVVLLANDDAATRPVLVPGGVARVAVGS